MCDWVLGQKWLLEGKSPLDALPWEFWLCPQNFFVNISARSNKENVNCLIPELTFFKSEWMVGHISSSSPQLTFLIFFPHEILSTRLTHSYYSMSDSITSRCELTREVNLWWPLRHQALTEEYAFPASVQVSSLKSTATNFLWNKSGVMCSYRCLKNLFLFSLSHLLRRDFKSLDLKRKS